MFHGLLEFVSGSPTRGKLNANSDGAYQLHVWYESQGSSRLHGRGPWLMCEAALSCDLIHMQYLQHLICTQSNGFF